MSGIRVCGIVGSPRKNKNSDTLVQKVLEGCRSQGVSVDKIYLNDLEISPCQAHRLQNGKGCVLQDGMSIIYQLFEDVHGLVLGTPVYYNSVSSQMKLMIDRSYCLAKAVTIAPGKNNYISTVKRHKKGVVVSVGGSGLHPDCVLPIFDIWSNEINLEIADNLCVSDGQIGALPMESKEILDMAFQKGVGLANLLLGY